MNTEGSSDSEKVNGAVNAKLSGLIGKLANLGVSGDGSYSADHYIGLIREDLPTALKNVEDCKTNVFNKLQPVLVPGSKPNPERSDISCPSIAGSWYSSQLNLVIAIRQYGCLVIAIRQHGCEISSEYTKNYLNLLYYCELTGHAVGDKFEYTVNQTYPNGCTAIFYGRLTAIEQQQMISHIDRSSSQCGVAQTFTQTLTLVRR